MGRSKFPGKPSKHCHRKRVNVLPPTGELSQENVGISVVTVIGASQEDKQEDDLPENEGESTSQTQQKTTRPLRRRLTRKISTTIRKNNPHQRNFIKKLRNKTTTVVSSQINRNSINKKGHKETATTTTTTNFGGKFVLPTRSVHSSRVIKPNKRFIDLNETLSSIKKKHPVNNNKSLEKISNNTTNNTDNNIIDININNNSKEDKLAFSNGHRVILRQARLKLPSQVGTQGPFSTNLHNGPGTIICGVCGAVRYYRFVKQARKFNIYSCESCRKFILKQIKRQNVGSGSATGGNSSSSVLICLNGQGNCYVPPVERTQHWKISKCAYRSRCPACWLKMCLKAFHLPLTVKQNLTQLLPKNMRGIDFSFSSSLPPILWQKKSELTAEGNSSSKERPVRFKSVQNNNKAQFNNVPTLVQQQPLDIKRQKIDLKGPRVKHVCRSASIVLGQPLATFGGDNSSDNNKKTNVETSDLKIDLKDPSVSISESISSKSIYDDDDDTVNNIEENAALINDINFNNKALEKVVAKKEQRASNFPLQNNQEFVSNNYAEPRPPQGILLDQPQDINFDNRFKSGFSLMLSKDTSIYALCFLCGSMGDEDVLICSLCCEIYHTFCLEEFGCSITFKKDWICMRCVPCKTCKLTDSRSKISCPKCLEIYHNDCFNHNNKADNINSFKLLCKECTRCSECHTTTVYNNMSSFPGNLPLCLNCLDIKKFGKYCPICEHSFEDSNTNLKMLECCKCKKWVHSDCEKLTSEQYDILNLLSVSSTFNCTQCLMEGQYNTWYRSVQKEIHRGFKRIFRLLAKNKSAKIILLTKSNLKGTIFRQYVLTKSLDIDNNNYDNKDIDKIYSFEESDQLPTDSSNNGFHNLNTLVDIKHRLWEYESVKKFNNDMEEALKLYDSNQLIFIYKSIFSKVFPWFNEVHEAAINESTISDVSLFRKEYFTKYSKIPQSKTDTRKCELCFKIGDGLSYEESRLVYCGNNNWVHANCAYWSTNVYEQIDNYLQNVIFTIMNSKNLRCIVCGQFGASIQCHLCRNFNYHFMCARKSEFYFSKVRKSCFCPKHPPETPRYILKSNGDFCVSQSLFIDQSLKEPHRSEPHAVKCLVGSLNVKNLGKIEPILSDLGDAIIPADFLCSKLFWSTKDPWKLTTYIITTSIQNPNCTTLTVDKNFTVDHSLEPDALEQAIKELNDWRRVYERKSEELDSEDDEEEKNGTQLLSPELTNTILEDLPHDILDGISVQDIFTNFSYEDMLNLDNSNTESIAESLKKPEDDDLITDTTNMMIKEINKSKSDCGLFRSSNKLTPLSFTVSCKVDSSSNQPPVSKKRKISKESNNILLLQLDGTVDDSSSECGSPVRNQAINIWTISEEPVTCEKCNSTYRTQASYKRHLDSCELLCTSESDSENQPDHELIEESNLIQSQPLEVTIQVNHNEPASQHQQPVLFQAFESYQSQVHTSVVNVDSSATSQQQQQITQVQPGPTITLTEPTPISISVPLCVGSQLVQSSIEFQQQPHHHHHQPQQMALQSMQQVLMQQRSPPRRDPTSVVIQQIHQPSTNSGFVPFAVDAFGQHHHQTSTNQNTLQYVQLAPQVQHHHHQPQLLQIRSDNGNVIGIIQPNIQPTTVIVQQQPPQQSLVLDSSGTFGWTTTQQIQPPQLYYGFETIVQNTVMQSQHFLPTPVPGVLAANSSFSTTTQVFQTSKLEPVLDVSSNSFVLVNSSTQQQLEIPQQFSSQAQPTTIVTSQTPSLIYSTHPSTTTTQKTISNLPQQQQQQNSITLPSAPSFISSDHSIPMNVVPPIQKPPTSHSRPMSRVLPMPTIAGRTSNNNSRKIADATKLFPDVEKPAQIKLDDKFMLSKDLMKIIDNPKVGKNRKFEILDYKIIKSQPTKIFKVEEKTFSREFEPAEKNPKLLIHSNNYEPLKEIEKVKMMPSSVFENNNKPLLLLEETNNYLKLNNIPSSSPPSTMLENNNKPNQRNNKNEKNYQIINKPKSNESPPKPPKQIDIDNMSSSDINSILIENNLQKLEESITKQNNIMQLSSSSSSTQNNYKENNITILQNERISKKFDILLAAAPKNSQLKNNLPKPSHSEVTQHLKKPIIINNEIPEKYLDMPQLDDIIPEFNPHQQPKEEIENLSMFNLPSSQQQQKPSIDEESPPKSIINKLQIVPPLLSVKPQLKEITKTLQMMDKSSTDDDLLEPNKLPSIRKECDQTGAPTIIYTIENKEEGFKYSSASITECWTKVFDVIQSARALHQMSQLQLDAKQLKSIQITNLKSNHIKYLVEQLPGVTKCLKYKPSFKILPSSSSFALQDEFCAHGFGAARCQPHKGGHSEPYDGFSWLSSKHRGFNSSDLQAGYSRRLNNFPIAMKFKNLKLASKQSVGVYRSKIHGKGLFCLRDIETGEMVIEYAGEVIRSILTDKREKYYNSKEIGCYMFRVDDNVVIDATMKGNAARFINHSCDPNCYSKVVEIMGHKHIIIFALRRIFTGEELTYDYKFPFEEDKIPCTCGAKKCRKFLN